MTRIEQTRKEEDEKYIARQMKKRKWFGFGGPLYNTVEEIPEDFARYPSCHGWGTYADAKRLLIAAKASAKEVMRVDTEDVIVLNK